MKKRKRKKKLSKKKIGAYSTTKTSDVIPFVTVTQSAESYIAEEEIAQIKETPKPSWKYDEEEQEETDTFTQNTRQYSTFDGE